MHILLTAHRDLSKLDQCFDRDRDGSAKNGDTSIPVLDGDRPNDFVTSMAMVLKNINVPRVKQLEKLDVDLVLMMVMHKGLPKQFTNVLQLLPVTCLIVVSTNEFRGNYSIVMADLRAFVHHGDDFLVVFMSMTMAMFVAERTKSVEDLDCRCVSWSEMLSVGNEDFLVDFYHLVPVFMLLVEFDKGSVSLCHALILDMAGVEACSVDPKINALSLVEMVRLVMANRELNGNFNSL